MTSLANQNWCSWETIGNAYAQTQCYETPFTDPNQFVNCVYTYSQAPEMCQYNNECTGRDHNIPGKCIQGQCWTKK